MKTYFRVIFIYFSILSIFVLCVNMPSLAASAASKSTQQSVKTSIARSCQAGWVYDAITVLGYPFVQIGPLSENVNDTGESETNTFTEATTGTVAVVTSRGLLVTTDIILASVTYSTSKAVVRAITVTTGNTVDFTAPAHKVAHAEYGVNEIQVRGHYYYRDQFCNIPFFLDEGEVISSCPWYAGWHTWLSDTGEESVPTKPAVPSKQAVSTK